MAMSTGSATLSSGRHMRPARHNFPNAILSDRERAHDLDRRAFVQGSDQGQDMLRFLMISQWTCHCPKIARKRRCGYTRGTRQARKLERKCGDTALPQGTPRPGVVLIETLRRTGGCATARRPVPATAFILSNGVCRGPTPRSCASSEGGGGLRQVLNRLTTGGHA